MEQIIIKDLLKSPYAVSTDEGEKIFDKINAHFKDKEIVKVDFDGIDLIVSTFLNAAIGQLYGTYPVDFIQTNLSVVNMSNEDLDMLKKVTDRAKQYFKDKKSFEQASKKSFPDA